MMKAPFGRFLYLGVHMSIYEHDKVMIVEGSSDKRKVKPIIKEPVDIICTNGTISRSRMDELIDTLLDHEIYILVDADNAGEKLRKQLRREFPEARHLYIDKMYREVASAPEYHLAEVLLKANFDVFAKYLDRG